MRKAYNGEVLKIDDKLVGVNLGADYCAEHEWGIRVIQDSFGIDADSKSKFGLERRKIARVPKNIWLREIRGTKKTARGAILLHDDFGSWIRDEAERAKSQAERLEHLTKKGELFLYGDKTLTCAWDEKSFGLYTIDKETTTALTELHAAILNLDAAIWLGGGGVFQNAGLVIAIASRVPADKAALMRETDEDHARLLDHADSTGIEKLLESKGKKWFALSPKWKFKNTETKTDYDVVFWLNPHQQDVYNHGWFTVEQLREWAENRGPVVKARTR